MVLPAERKREEEEAEAEEAAEENRVLSVSSGEGDRDCAPPLSWCDKPLGLLLLRECTPRR
jgi:hypothetical protein